MNEYKADEERPMVCQCGSKNIHTHLNIGCDIDVGGEENQHMDICVDCGMKRFWVERYDNLKPVKFFVDKWEKNGFLDSL